MAQNTTTRDFSLSDFGISRIKGLITLGGLLAQAVLSIEKKETYKLLYSSFTDLSCSLLGSAGHWPVLRKQPVASKDDIDVLMFKPEINEFS